MSFSVTSNRIEATGMDCAGYCKHLAGGHLLTTVLGPDPGSDPAGNPRTIVMTLGGPAYTDFRKHATESMGEVSWGATSESSVCLLAHELIHAYHDLVDRFQGDKGPGAISFEERCTACAENQIRAEMGVVRRECYGALPVECADLGKFGDCVALPTKPLTQWGCTCDGGGEGEGTPPGSSESLDCDDVIQVECVAWSCDGAVEVQDTLPPADDLQTVTGGGSKDKDTESGNGADLLDPGSADVTWECACTSTVPTSPAWSDMGEAHIPTGWGDVTVALRIYARVSGDRIRVRLLRPCVESCSNYEAALERVIATARRVRLRDTNFGRVDEALNRILGTFSHTIMLERVTPFGGYAAMALAASDDPGGPVPIVFGDFSVIPTDDRLDPDVFIATSLSTGGAEALDATHASQITATTDAILDLPSQTSGDPWRSDAATYFLTVHRAAPASTRRIVLTGYRTFGFDAHAEPDRVDLQDRPSWDAITTVIRLWLAVSPRPPSSSGPS